MRALLFIATVLAAISTAFAEGKKAPSVMPGWQKYEFVYDQKSCFWREHTLFCPTVLNGPGLVINATGLFVDPRAQASVSK